jgi:hypothetical protein
MQACHNDGDPAHNNWWNLRWDTPKNNCADKYRHGTDQRGEKHHNASLTWAEVREIRRRHANGETKKSLALEFRVRVDCIYRIVKNLSWIE